MADPGAGLGSLAEREPAAAAVPGAVGAGEPPGARLRFPG
jgi:hypothetical protein